MYPSFRKRWWLLLALLGCSAAHAELAAIVSAKHPAFKMSIEEVAKVFLAKATTFPDG